jgi:hypothetical protein
VNDPLGHVLNSVFLHLSLVAQQRFLNGQNGIVDEDEQV